ncbi:MAG: hypothetical protein ACKOW9_05025 [Candidatus Paceibacterota bacterium]
MSKIIDTLKLVSVYSRTLQNQFISDNTRAKQSSSCRRLSTLVKASVAGEIDLWMSNDKYVAPLLKEYSYEDLVAINFIEYIDTMYRASSLGYEESSVISAHVESIIASYVKCHVASIPLLVAESVFGGNVTAIFDKSNLSKYQVASAAGLKPFYNWQRTNKLSLFDTDSSLIPASWLISLKGRPHTSLSDILQKDCSWLGFVKAEQLLSIGLPLSSNESVEICLGLINDSWDGDIKSVVDASNLLSL